MQDAEDVEDAENQPEDMGDEGNVEDVFEIQPEDMMHVEGEEVRGEVSNVGSNNNNLLSINPCRTHIRIISSKKTKKKKTRMPNSLIRF